MIKSFMLLGVLSILAISQAKESLSDAAADKMTKLNGCPAFRSDFYSGILQGNNTDTKGRLLATGHNYHYLMVKSEKDPETAPVVFWFNGGPGCSSMLAFSQENGPFFVDNVASTCTENPYSWTKNFTMVWLEHPVGVGFSEAPEGLVWNDIAASMDQFAGISLFFERHPDLINNDLYLSGESYGGIYVPYGSWQIYQNNLQFNVTNGCSAKNLYPNNCTQGNSTTGFVGQYYMFKGMMIGNGATNWHVDAGKEAYIDTLWGFNMIPTNLHTWWKDQKCQDYFGEVLTSNLPGNCSWIIDQVNKIAAGTDIYDLYRESNDVALQGESRYGQSWVGGELKTYKKGATVREYTPWMVDILGEGNPSLDQQIHAGDFLSEWLNDNTTRADLNIPTSVHAWEECSSVARVNDTYKLQKEGSFWIYRILASNGFRILHYSGDTDGAVPTIGTKRWVKLLDSPTKPKGGWRPWYSDFQVGGMVQNHEILDFATVRGVGHMAPQWAPAAVLKMVSEWVFQCGEMMPAGYPTTCA